jgi:predicted small lipoprotein YifL
MRLVRRYFLSAHVILVTVVSLAGCGGHKSQAHSPHHHDTLVPQETQKEAERNMGEQQMMMNDLNMTPSERAGQTHQRATDRRQKNNDDVKR